MGQLPGERRGFSHRKWTAPPHVNEWSYFCDGKLMTIKQIRVISKPVGIYSCEAVCPFSRSFDGGPDFLHWEAKSEETHSVLFGYCVSFLICLCCRVYREVGSAKDPHPMIRTSLHPSQGPIRFFRPRCNPHLCVQNTLCFIQILYSRNFQFESEEFCSILSFLY